jgi:hypothetical protein
MVQTPNVTISGPTFACWFTPVTLSVSGAQSYSWNTGQTSSTLSVMAYTGNVYYLTGTDVNGCAKTATHTLSTQWSPSITANSGTVCQGSPFTITITPWGAVPGGGPPTYTLEGPSLYSVSASPVFTVYPTTNTQYSLTMKWGTFCESNIALSNVSVVTSPTVSALTPSLCAGIQPTFNPQGALSYTIQNPSFNQYVIFGSNSAGCISEGFTVTPFIYPGATLSAVNGSICPGNNFTITPLGGVNYSITGNTLVVSPASTSVYSLTGTNAWNCPATNTAVVMVSVFPNPTLSVSGSTTVCSGKTTTLTASGANSYTWNSSVVANPLVVAPAAITIYTLNGKTVNGCSGTLTIPVNVLANPTVSILNPTLICFGDSATFIASGANNYTWSSPASTTNPLVFLPQTNITLTVTGSDGNGCEDVAVTSLSVASLPQVSASINSPSICLGETVTINALGATNYSITGGVLNNVPFIPLTSTIYTITGIDLNNCATTTTLGLTAFSNPLVTAGSSSTFICAGASLTLMGGGATTYTWSGGVQNNSPFFPLVSKVYTVTGTDLNGCKGKDSIGITVHSLPQLTISATQSISCLNEPVTLSVQGNASSYFWSTGSNSQTLLITPALGSSTYSVIGTGTAGCTKTMSLTLLTDACTGLSENGAHLGISIFPNPTSGTFYIRSDEPLNMVITNISGQIILNKDLMAGTNELSFGDSSPGIYFVQLRSGNLLVEKKLLVFE